MRRYELVFVVRPEIEAEELTAIIEGISQLISGDGGQVVEVDSWGKRQLAYPIQKLKEGHYVVMQTQLEPGAIKGLERNLKLREEIIRYLLVRSN